MSCHVLSRRLGLERHFPLGLARKAARVVDVAHWQRRDEQAQQQSPEAAAVAVGIGEPPAAMAAGAPAARETGKGKAKGLGNASAESRIRKCIGRVAD